eukprot:CAMPEP_0201540114 /NCGR_PEP_ID=MMETSP0161_2-20130828/70773_1 /ASSEMBLY_ACC=CAM_ASM_000251 /TAXON_ID=180227 /ORGANISM="Neoparamoeba aestuarina, Strain SoJaBio B1-5/56/2" /LENGTH=509 /DNA_ID=CAMNT_0047947561 /DNA_START=49 /DNA_END=1578 /DNA_ORIENTATION=+
MLLSTRNVAFACRNLISSGAFTRSFTSWSPSFEEEHKGKGVGIHAMQIVFPKTYVAQSDLELADGVGEGKYRKGLGQENMAFTSDREDMPSLAMTAVQRLFDRDGVDPARCGRLEVGTETLIDKSKSTKSYLMPLFGNNSAILGIDTINACYGGTSALFNAAQWCESSLYEEGQYADTINACYGGTSALFNAAQWCESSLYEEGQYAIVVAGDIAVYEPGPARPTGGAGAVAMLVGPNAPLQLEGNRLGVHMEHQYDFYKPSLGSEYPAVDGALSIECYFRALDLCYERWIKKGGDAQNQFDYACFHSPFGKLVEKSFARLLYRDFLRNPEAVGSQVKEALAEFAGLDAVASYSDRGLQNAVNKLAAGDFAQKVLPGAFCSKNLGNLYTGSVYGNLLSLIEQKGRELENNRVMMFSYGSGVAATMFSFVVPEGRGEEIQSIADHADINSRFSERSRKTADEMVSALSLREQAYGAKSFVPKGSVDELFPKTWYLANVDDKHRREYAFKE